jgi:hypothetical protein
MNGVARALYRLLDEASTELFDLSGELRMAEERGHE